MKQWKCKMSMQNSLIQLLEKDITRTVLSAVVGLLIVTCGAEADQSRLDLTEQIIIPEPDGGVIVNTNDPVTIQKELLDVSLIKKLAEVHNLSSNDLRTIEIKRLPTAIGVLLVQNGDSTNVCDLFKHELRRYVWERSRGHTPEYFLATVTNEVHRQVVEDLELSLLIKHEPLIPLHLVRIEDSGSYTNRAGTAAGTTSQGIITNGRLLMLEHTNLFLKDEIVRWVNYLVVDGEVAWKYQVRIDPTVPCPWLPFRVDSKDYDPRFRQIIKSVEAEVNLQMKADGARKRVGTSGAVFERMKKEKLKIRGIEWRTSAELNPQDKGDVILEQIQE